MSSIHKQYTKGKSAVVGLKNDGGAVHMGELEFNFEIIRKAYKKLKSSVYFDKTQLVLRDEIVKYESEILDLDEELDSLWYTLNNEADWERLKEDILSSISVLSFPKKLKHEDKSIISNSAPVHVDVIDLQHFINMDVRGHIIGVLWLLMIGWRIDKDIYEHSYGNRIRKKLINELSDEPTYSPYLFEPYFEQYESWRDSALNYASKCLTKKQDVVILTLDFRRFFYSVNMDENAFDNVLKEAGITPDEGPFLKRINDFIYSVIDRYASKFNDEYDKRKILPIGFLPSYLLANWCLNKFDKAVINGWNPIYYGRYVDDILIVDKVEKNSDIYQKAIKQELNREEVIQFFLTQCCKWNGIPNEGKLKTELALLKIDKKLTNKENKGKPKSEKLKVYAINDIYNSAPGSKIVVQNDKVKIFYFQSGETDALISCFQKNISSNKSEFRYMPEDEAIFQDDDYSEIYYLENKDSPNKLRSVDGVSINKFALSKFLGKYLRISGLVNDKIESRFEKDISKIFNNQTVIENYLTWEKVIEIFVINNCFDALLMFVNKILNAINKISYSGLSKTEKRGIQESLLKHLYSSLCRAFALNWGERPGFYIKIIRDLWNEMDFDDDLMNIIDGIRDQRLGYCKTRMLDKYVMPVLIDAFFLKDKDFQLNDQSEINLTNFSQILTSAIDESNFELKQNLLELDYKYYPYMVTMYDLCIHSAMNILQHSNEESLNKSCDFPLVVEMEKEIYTKFNYAKDPRLEGFKSIINVIKNKEIPGTFIIKVGNVKKDSLTVAIANVQVSHSNFELIVKDRPNREYKRYKELSNVINQSIKEKADMLVMPESFIPFDWLPTVARTCAKNQLAVVTGVEHIKIKDKMYNFTAVILPYNEDDYKCAHITFHLKKHYSPQEIHEIEGYRLKPVEGKAYELYYWNDCWFPVYCCYELSSIKDRSLFQSYADALIAVEWNPDTNYYSNILESLSRDIHCYCVQVNSSNYGDSRITKPSKTENKDIIRTKGGINSTVLIDRIDIKALREHQFKEYELQKALNTFKPTPPDFDKKIVQQKMKRKLWKQLSIKLDSRTTNSKSLDENTQKKTNDSKEQE